MKKLIALLILLTLPTTSFSLTTTNDYDFPLNYKTRTFGQVNVSLGVYETQTYIDNEETQHLYQIRINNTRNQNLNIPNVMHRFDWNIFGGINSVTFYNRTSVLNQTVCENEYYNETEEREVCRQQYTSIWTPIALNSIIIGRRTVANYLISINSSNWARGEFNYSFNGSGFNFFLDPTVSACGQITTPGYYSLTQNIATSSGTICLNISSNDVDLDCRGMSVGITGTTTTQRQAIFAANVSAPVNSFISNLTIRNCVINATSANLSFGMSLTRPLNFTLANNTVGNYSGRTGNSGTSGTTCTNGANGVQAMGVRIQGGRNGTVHNNTIYGITGGSGGHGGNDTSVASDPGCDPGNGADAFGLHMGSIGATFTHNVSVNNLSVVNIFGGAGGDGGDGQGSAAVGGTTGNAYGIFFTSANGVRDSNVTNSYITNVSGLRGGQGGVLLNQIAASCKNGNTLQAAGGDASEINGMWVSSATNIRVENVTFKFITGAKGGPGGTGSNLCDGQGGLGGEAVTIQDETTNGLYLNITILNTTGGAGGDNLVCSCVGAPSGSGMNAYGMIEYVNSNFSSSYARNLTGGSPGSGSNKGSSGTAYGTYLSAAENAYFINSTFDDLGGYMTYNDIGARNNWFINTSFSNTTKFFYTIVDGFECNPCNFTVQWYGRINVTDGNSAPLTSTINVSDSHYQQQYFNPALAITPWILFNDSIYNDTFGNSPAYTWNPYNVSANTTTLSNYTLFNYNSRDLSCWLILSPASTLINISYGFATPVIVPNWRKYELEGEEVAARFDNWYFIFAVCLGVTLGGLLMARKGKLLKGV